MEAVLTNFLLGSRLYDEISLEKFKDLFPAKYRNDDDIRRLYKEFQAERRRIREKLTRNIDSEVQALERDAKKRKVTSSSLNDAVEHLQQQTKDLQTEMARLEEQCEVYLGKLQKFDEALASVPTPRNVNESLVTLEGTKSVVANLRAAAE